VNLNNEARLVDEIGKLRKEVERLKRVESGGVWTTWTPTVTGWAALPTGSYRYCQIGKLVTLQISMVAGTSNANNAKLSLPVNSANTGSSSHFWAGTNGAAIDNGVSLNTATRWIIYSNTGEIIFSINMLASGTTGWTASGDKRIYCIATYEAA
jgi:hypothetical protein